MNNFDNSIRKRKKLKQFLIILLIVVITFLIIASILNKLNRVKQLENKNKEYSNEEIIEFAKNEIKRKLNDPEILNFLNEKLNFQENKYVVNCYCISKSENKKESKVKFEITIQKTDNGLKCVNVISNEDTCTKDSKEIVIKLLKEQKYNEIFNEWFNSITKMGMNYDKFTNYLKRYPIDLETAIFEETEYEENKSIKLVIKNNNSNGSYGWYFIFLNGQVYQFDIAIPIN